MKQPKEIKLNFLHDNLIYNSHRNLTIYDNGSLTFGNLSPYAWKIDDKGTLLCSYMGYIEGDIEKADERWYLVFFEQEANDLVVKQIVAYYAEQELLDD